MTSFNELPIWQRIAYSKQENEVHALKIPCQEEDWLTLDPISKIDEIFVRQCKGNDKPIFETNQVPFILESQHWVSTLKDLRTCGRCSDPVDQNFKHYVSATKIQGEIKIFNPEDHTFFVIDQKRMEEEEKAGCKVFILRNKVYRLSPIIKNIVNSSLFRGSLAFLNCLHWISYGALNALSKVLKKISKVVPLIFAALSCVAYFHSSITLLTLAMRITCVVLFVRMVIRIINGIALRLPIPVPKLTPKEVWNDTWDDTLRYKLEGSS